MTNRNDKQKAIASAIKELMRQVDEMPIGGNLMNLLEREIPKLNRQIVETAIEKRDEINLVRKDDFPPSDGLPQVRQADSNDESGKT